VAVDFQPKWDAALAAAGASDELHFHDLRPTGNTLAARSGASLREPMAHIGHASPRSALLYQHGTKDPERAIGDVLGGLIERRRESNGAGSRSPVRSDRARGGHAAS
jgi:integrase